MQVYRGFSALSAFRTRKLLKQLQVIDNSITGLTNEYVHFVDTATDLSATEEQELKALLTYGIAEHAQPEGHIYVVVPRPGTISSWSSKATDIALNAGLASVKRIERGTAYYITATSSWDIKKIGTLLHDRMVESVLSSFGEAVALFADAAPKPLKIIDIQDEGKRALETANKSLGLALAVDEIDYLFSAYSDLKRNPTDVELMMFSVVNSEHCRHKIFNADWVADGQKQPKSLFKMIKNTYEKNREDVLSAYSDNAAVLKGKTASRFFADHNTKTFQYHHEPIHSVIKVETHNHPTAIAPGPGAATGIGGEIRDEAATGRGAKAKMGLSGFTVSNLCIPNALQPWEKPYGKPDRIVSALDIMLDAPIGGAAYANEFGRPNVAGYFRTYEEQGTAVNWGYHKPIMIAGGLGNIRDPHVQKQTIPDGAHIIVLGGPSMLIGLGGGAAASMQTGQSAETLDFASVQRANAEMERRCQEVIDACWAQGDNNPIITIHDVGAGGLSNALPELVHDSGRGALFELRSLPTAEASLSPMEIWSNESQERYVLAINDENLPGFEAICDRERCPFAVVGKATKNQQLVLHDALFDNHPINMPMSVLFGKPPKMTKDFKLTKPSSGPFDFEQIDLSEAVERVLHVPSVGSKKFLITIGDRTVGGLITRDQMVGPWQVPVSDVAVAASAFDAAYGEAMAMGERTPLAIIDAPASARIAIGETITNLLAADIEKLSDIKLSANWMAASGYGQEDEKLFNTVKAVGEEFCPALGLTIPVGKDSLSMRTLWQEDGKDKSVTSPLSLIISGFSPVKHVGQTLTPQLKRQKDTVLLFIDLGNGQHRLGGSALAQTYNQIGGEAPDVEAKLLKQFFLAVTALKQSGKILAYHDRSDGGLLATILEMAFAGRCGLDVDVSQLVGSGLELLFNEELGAVIQINTKDQVAVIQQLQRAGNLPVHVIGVPSLSSEITIKYAGGTYRNTRAQLERWWSDTSYNLQKLRDDPDCAEQESARISDGQDPGLTPLVTFEPSIAKYNSRPKVAILREQGVNGHIEMAAAFDRAGFTCVDVHLHDLMNGKAALSDFKGLAVCGGFSYGDVLGAGEGWAKSILFSQGLRQQFSDFFERSDTFSLGVCNGCQMLAALKELIPGADAWPAFLKNTSEQFEARLVTVQINDSPSIFFKDMAGSRLLVPVAHGEGRAHFSKPPAAKQALKNKLVPLQYVDNYSHITEAYPSNPNGSPLGITALTTLDGRATILMPHPERSFMSRQLSWHPTEWGPDSPWLKLFQNARQWVENQNK